MKNFKGLVKHSIEYFFAIYTQIRDHFEHHQFEHIYGQILMSKKRLPLHETKVFSLNIGGLKNKIPSLILALIRGEEVFDIVFLQETNYSGFHLPCYNSFYSDKCVSKSGQRIHGVATYTCNIISNDGTSIISKQQDLSQYQSKEMKNKILPNQNPISAILIEYKKIKINKSNIIEYFNSPDNLNLKDSMDMLLNLYLPNYNSVPYSNLNTDICTVLLPNLFKQFKNLNVFSDSNADFNQLYTINSGNEKLIRQLLKQCDLQQLNKTIANTFVGSLEPRVIAMFTVKKIKCHIK